jgi:hypothetical protein
MISRALLLTLCLVATASACGDGNSSQAASKKEMEISVCTLISRKEALSGKRVKVRTELEIGVEFIKLQATGCDTLNIFAVAARNGLNLNGCSSSDGGEQFGCPFNPDTGVRVTLDGIFSVSKGIGRIAVLSVSDISTRPAPL